MWSALHPPTSKSPLDVATFVSYVLPPLLFYFVMAIMAVTPQTRTLRLALWPLVAFLAFRAARSVMIMFSDDSQPPIGLEVFMLFFVTRSLYWALAKEPLVRRYHSENNPKLTLSDALDLATTFRGHDWDWSTGLHVPRETRPADRIRFASRVALSATVHALVCGILYRALRSFTPLGLGSVVGISIFDDTLPWMARYLRSSVITVIGCLASYTFLQANYDLYTLVGVLVLRHDPFRWPPGFDAPWRASSLTDFWGRRWHQWLRHTFLVQGGYPLGRLLGRPGLVLGAFLASAVFHHVGLYTLDPASAELWRMVVGFGMMAPAVLAERAFARLTGKRVGGWAGWAWTMAWLVLWGNLIVDGFVRAAMFRSGALADVVLPLRRAVERLVMDLDAWLHEVTVDRNDPLVCK